LDRRQETRPAQPGLAIEVAGLTKIFGRTTALRNISLQVPWGVAVALLGPNGAGKSTLLRAIAMLARPDEGTVRVAGVTRGHDAARARAALGYVGHQPLLYDDLTPEENLRFYARLHDVRDAGARIRQVLADVGMSHRATSRVRTLSNGMQKRIAIARALLHRPAVLLLDEPETGLDQEGLALLGRIVRGVADGGATVLFSTHDIERALALADRVALLRGGRLVLDASRAAADAASLRALLADEAEARR